jgi:hypothetical protein
MAVKFLMDAECFWMRSVFGRRTSPARLAANSRKQPRAKLIVPHVAQEEMPVQAIART